MVSKILKFLLCTLYVYLSLYIAVVKGKTLTEQEKINKLAFSSSEITSEQTVKETSQEETSAAINDTGVVTSEEPKLHIYPNGSYIVVPVGEYFGLTCDGIAEDGQVTDMKWFFSNGTDYIEIKDNLKKVEPTKLYLAFPSPSVENSGNYTCTAIFNQIEIEQAEVEVHFFDRGSTMNTPEMTSESTLSTTGEETDPCSDVPCMNGGRCFVIGRSVYCNCKEPYTGVYCEINLCPEKLCQNGGICRPFQGKGQCFCKEPYSGRFCEMDDCATNNICRNGGICKKVNNEMKCFCVDPYGGKYCDIQSNIPFSRLVYVIMYVLMGLVLMSLIVVCTLCCAFCRIARQAKKN